jgi:hypothetical protein
MDYQNIHELETKRHALMLRAAALTERCEDLAIRILVDGDRLQEMELREHSEEIDYLRRKAYLHDLAIAGLRRRALNRGRDAATVMAEIIKGKSSTE